MLISVDDGRRLNPDWWRARAIEAGDRLFRCDVCARLYGASAGGVCPRWTCPGTLQPIAAGDLSENHYRKLYEQSLPGNMRVEEHTAQLDLREGAGVPARV